MGGVVKKVTGAAKKTLGSVGKVFGFDPKAAADAAGKQTKAIQAQTAADVQAMQDQAVAAQRNLESQIANRAAIEQAQVDVAAPEAVDVSVAGQNTSAGTDETGRKRRPREQFQAGGGSGIRIT